MTRQPIESSNLAEVGYDEGSQVMEVKFKSGVVYQYCGVPKDQYMGLMAAQSLGAYFSKFFRNNYPFKRIEEE